MQLHLKTKLPLFLPSEVSGRRHRPTTEPLLVTHDIFCCEITTVQWACTGRWLCRFLPEVEREIFDFFYHWNRSCDYCCFTLIDSEDLPTIEKQPSQEEQRKNKRKTKQTIRKIMRKVLEKSHNKQDTLLITSSYLFNLHWNIDPMFKYVQWVKEN